MILDILKAINNNAILCFSSRCSSCGWKKSRKRMRSEHQCLKCHPVVPERSLRRAAVRISPPGVSSEAPIATIDLRLSPESVRPTLRKPALLVEPPVATFVRPPGLAARKVS